MMYVHGLEFECLCVVCWVCKFCVVTVKEKPMNPTLHKANNTIGRLPHHMRKPMALLGKVDSVFRNQFEMDKIQRRKPKTRNTLNHIPVRTQPRMY